MLLLVLLDLARNMPLHEAVFFYIFMESNNSRIAKNTLYMYLRMIVMLFISLYTARIVFNALGVDNFGIYNIVGSVVIFLSFLNNGLSNATKRYITAEIATGSETTGKNVFSSALVAHILISLLLIIVAESVGLYLVNYVLNIPPERLHAANIVYQLSLVTAIIGVMQSPFSSAILAYEKMSIYAYITIFDAVIKLIIVFVLQIVNYDELIVYSILLTFSSLVSFLVFIIYSLRNIEICSLTITSDGPLIKKMFKYTSWSLVGQVSVVATNQGCSMLVNYFTSVAVNAAMGVSNTITRIVNDFVTNFQIAFNPQITKHYVSKEFDELNALVYRTSSYSSYLVLLFMLPVCFEAGDLLHLWLGNYPKYTVEFCVLTMIAIYFEAITAPLWMVLCSDSDIKTYQITVSLIFFLNVIFTWIFLALGIVPYVVMVIRSLVNIVLIATRLLFIEYKIKEFSKYKWVKEVFGKSILLMIFPFIITYLLCIISIELMLLRLFVVSGVSFVSTAFCIFFFGMDAGERHFLVNKIKSKL